MTVTCGFQDINAIFESKVKQWQVKLFPGDGDFSEVS